MDAQWISVAEQLPDSMAPVLAYYRNSHGQGRRIRAIYVARMTWPNESEDDPDYGDYCAETDQRYWPAGWYECAEHSEHLYPVDEAVTLWMEMPEAPA
jgi:hypothetical protein